MNTIPTLPTSVTEELDRIVGHVGRYGVAESEPQMHRLAGFARTFAVQPAVSSLLTDPTAPDVVRSRAFARVVAGLRALPMRSPTVSAA